MKATLVLCLAILLVHSSVVIAQSNPINKFKSNFQATELDINSNAVVRTYTGTFYYEDTWNAASNPTGHQAMRFDINLNDGTTTRTLTQYYIYQDQFFKYTVCNGKCAWQDLFAEEPLPKLYIQNGDPTPTGPTTINGVSAVTYTFTTTNAIGASFSNWIKLSVRAASPQYAVQASLTYTKQGIIQRLDFSSQENNFPASVWNIPTGCPVILPGCFRVDLSLVLDVSGSVTNAGVVAGIDFFIALASNFLIDSKHINMGLVSFSYCTNIRQQFPLLSSQSDILNRLNSLRSSLQSEGWTCIVGGINYGFFNFKPENGGRPATKKALLIVTDGNGNRPCSTRLIRDSPLEDCSQWDTSVVRQVAPICGSITYSPCNGGPCCQQIHDWQLKTLYAQSFATYNPTIYAVGVGSSSDISDATLNLIINDPVALARGDPRKFRVDSWFSLSTVLTALAKAIICDVEGSETCPNDCRPGGFCCAGGCLCSIDCSLQSTECQASVCKVDANGANCALGKPENTSCEDPRIFCVDRYCIENVGCRAIPNNNKNCTDNNACTDDTCNNGVCVSVTNPLVANCNDGNNCTKDDTCVDGVCQGITTDEDVTCDDGDLCTVNQCQGGVCQIIRNITCVDNDTSDCLYPQCAPKTGLCTLFPYPAGFECAPRDPFDNCTLYVCARFDANDYITCIANGNGDNCNKGQCRKATADLDECKDSSLNAAGIIGGAVAGAAFVAIVILAIIILVLFLLRKKVIDVLSGLNPFGKDVFVHDAPSYVNPVTSHENALQA